MTLHNSPAEAMNLVKAFILLLALLNVAAAVSCDVADVTALKDELRLSACRLRGNDAQTQTFRESVYEKHGQTGGKFPDHPLSPVNFVVFADNFPFIGFANLFRPTPALLWCRSSCSEQEMESGHITWCVNIAYLDRVVETCISRGADGQTVTNSTCEAELVGVPSCLSLPSVSNYCSANYKL